MKKISAIKTSKNMNEKSRSINQDFNFDKVRKITKTPDISNNNRKEARESVYHLLPNSELSFQQPDNFKHLFKNKEEYDNYLFYEKFITSQRKYNRMISEVLEMNKKFNDNNEKIEKLNFNLKKIKKEKNQKQDDIVNLLSNKESLEEIYKSKMSSLLRNSQILGLQFINGKKGPNERNNNNDKCNNNIDNMDCNPCSSIALFKENNYEINTDEIKLSDKNKFEEQVIIFTSDILQKNNDDEINAKLKEKIRKAYEIFNLEVCSPTDIEPDTVVNNFFTRISLYISNQSMGSYSEPFINSFLKHLLKINCAGVEISETIKFLNKTYQENKNELKEKITNLIKKNENLKNKKLSYKKQMNELKIFLDENREEFTAIKNIINENENSHYISFISSDNNNIKKKRSIKKDSCKTTRMVTDENLNTLKKNKISKLKEDFFNKNVKEENENINKLNVNDNSNCQDKDLTPKIKHIKYKSVNNNNDLFKENNQNEANENKSKNLKNKVAKKKINIINSTWDNGDDFNKNNYSKEYINISSITNVDNSNMNNNNIVRSFNNYVTNPIPNNKNKNNAKKMVNQKNNNTINVNNVLINNNIKIENNNNIINNNKIIKMNLNGNKSNPKIRIYNTNTDNFKLKSKKNTSCHNKTIKIKKRINVVSGTPSKIENRNDNIGNINNVNKTEIKANDDEDNKFMINNKVGEQNNSKDKIILLKDSRSNSHRNTNNENKTNIIYSPTQGNNRPKNIIYLKKDRNRNELLNSENAIKNSVNNGIFKISKSPKLYKQIPNRYNIPDSNNNNNVNSTNKNINKFYNQLSPKNKVSITQKYFSSNSYMNKSQDISNDISGERSDNLYSKRYDNRLRILTKDINESFCYIRLSDKNSMVFDPLDNCCTITPEICNYFEGHILIDIGFHKLKIIPKNVKDKHLDSMQILDELNDDEEEEGEDNEERKNRKCIGIELKEITDIQISDKMKNIIKIYSTYIKYGRGNENLNINKFIYMREINYIPMEHDDRIKSCFCNFFMFSLVFDNKTTPKVDFIFINYDEFNLWFNCFEYIIKNNIQYKKMASNSIGSPVKKNNN